MSQDPKTYVAFAAALLSWAVWAGVAPAQQPATTPVPTTTTAPTQPHPLARARALGDAEIAALPAADQERLADWLWVWQFKGAEVGVAGTDEDFVAATERARAIYRRLLAQRPDDSELYWKLARADYDLGELLPEDAVDRRMALYEDMVALTRTCIDEVDAADAGCWHFLATGIGRQATTRGVIASLFSADEVEETWLHAYALDPTTVALNGDPLMNGIRYGLGVFYRMVPDAWLVKLIAGVRGDIDRSIAYFREAAAVQPMRLELQKELAVALLCKADRDDDPAARTEGARILEQMRAGAFDAADVRAIDAIDKRHAADLLAHPERACGYSRDGYEDLDEDALDELPEPAAD